MLRNPPHSVLWLSPSPSKVLGRLLCAFQFPGTLGNLYPPISAGALPLSSPAGFGPPCAPFLAFLEKLRGHSVPLISAVESVCITTRHTGYSIGISFVTPSPVLFQASRPPGGSRPSTCHRHYDNQSPLSLTLCGALPFLVAFSGREMSGSQVPFWFSFFLQSTSPWHVEPGSLLSVGKRGRWLVLSSM